MDPVETKVRADHPEWTDEQVNAEVTRLKANPPAPAPSTPPASTDEAFARMRREKEDAERRATEAEQKVAEAERKKAEEEGRWKDLAEQEKQRADRLEAEQKAAADQRNAERTAGDLKFADAGYALYILQQDRVKLDDPAAVKPALEQLAARRPELLSTAPPPPPSGGPAGGPNPNPPGLTREQLSAMSQQQIAKLDPKIVNEALAG